jgi:hypothetical protein
MPENYTGEEPHLIAKTPNVVLCPGRADSRLPSATSGYQPLSPTPLPP